MSESVSKPTPTADRPRRRLPEWLKITPSGGEAEYARVKARLKDRHLHTVCEEARCPNRSECWGAGTATLLLLGDVCTRGCRFCSVRTGDPGGVVCDDEPARAAETVADLELDYVVLTSVDRDDLADGGAGVYAESARAIKARTPSCLVEALIPDFADKIGALAEVVAAPIDVVAHNLEVVQRLSPSVRDRRASYERSLDVLAEVKRLDPTRLTKSSLMLGLGESDNEVIAAMENLRAQHVDILTLGQYLQPTRRQLPVVEYAPPERFEQLRQAGERLGFRHVVSGPLVRSSHRAREAYQAATTATASA